MPIQQCQIGGKQGWRFGKSGRCYTGPTGKARARRQERAIRASGFTENARRLNPLRLDPTRTATLRRKFEEELARRFARLKRAVHNLVVVEDAFGLRRFRGFVLQERNDENHQIGLANSARCSAGSGGNGNNSVYTNGVNHADFDLDSGITTLNQQERSDEQGKMQIRPSVVPTQDRELAGRTKIQENTNRVFTQNQRWAFQTDPAKVEQFKQWLKTRVESDMFMAASGQLEEGYWETFVREGYRKGAGRAFDDVNRGKRAIATTEEDFAFFRGTKEQFLRESFAQPVAIDKVKLLAGRTLTDLQGVGQALATSLTRELAEGLVQGMNPREIARRMSRNLDIGKRRAQQIARTEIIRAHAEGALDSLEKLGVDRVGVMVEWSTAGDDRVCPLCEPMEGAVLRVSEARGMIPRHTQCRCTPIPANVGESTTKQKRTKGEIQGAIDDSIRAELPKGRDIKGVGRRFKNPETRRFTSKTKRTLAEQKRRTRWAGADKKIAKKRPRGVVEPSRPTTRPKLGDIDVATKLQQEIREMQRELLAMPSGITPKKVRLAQKIAAKKGKLAKISPTRVSVKGPTRKVGVTKAKPAPAKKLARIGETRDELRDKIKDKASMQQWLKENSRPVTGVKEHGMMRPERMRQVRVDGVLVQYSEKVSGHLADDLLEVIGNRQLPDSVWKSNRRVIYSSSRSAEDAFWKKKYGITGKKVRVRASGGKGTVVVYDGKIGAYDLSHESGHNLATKTWKSTTPPRSSGFGKSQKVLANGRVKDGVTEYGKVAADEDFAEAVAMYSDTKLRLELRQKHPDKFKALEAMLK